MSNLFLVFFCLLPWGSFFFRTADIWHAQGQYVQVGILILFCYSFFERPKYVHILNKPLGLFFLWTGLVTSYGWITVFAKTQHYPVKIFMPFFNLLCLILLYKLIIEYLDKDSIEKILKWFKYSFILLLLYCVLQYLKLDEFLTGIGGKYNYNGDQLVGTMANPIHLAGLLAIMQPLFFKKSRENTLSLILLWLIIFATGSATGIIAGVAVILFWLWFKNKKVAIISIGLSIISFIGLLLTHPIFFNNSDRFKVWNLAFNIIKNKFITGSGLGTVAISQLNKPNDWWQHLHNEYYQILFELGLIGLILVLYCIWDYFKIFKDLKTDLTIRLASIFFGFCLVALVLSPAHLWIPSVLGMFVFGSLYALKNMEARCAPALNCEIV